MTPIPRLRRFYLQRNEDETGVSGTGKVAEGVVWDDGKVAMRWLAGDHRSTVVYDRVADVEKIHGHNGRTVLVWVDPE